MGNPPSGTLYEPAGYPLTGSLGVHEFWNNATNMQYSRNLGGNTGIELVDTAPTVLSVLPASIQQGQSGVVSIQPTAQGTEAALGFSLNFDPTVLKFQQATLPSGTPATLNLNTSQLASGQLGVDIMANLTSTHSSYFPSGNSTILTLIFTSISSGTSAITTTIGFGDSPIACSVVDINADILPGAFNDGAVTVSLPPKPPVANNLTVSVNENTATPVTLQGSDPNNYPISYLVTSNPAHGTLSGTAPNLTYTPGQNTTPELTRLPIW